MEIISVEIDGVELLNAGIQSSRGYFSAFMRYCIDHFPNRIRNCGGLASFFKPIPKDLQLYEQSISESIELYKGYYFVNDHTINKSKRMKEIAKIMGLDLLVHQYQATRKVKESPFKNDPSQLNLFDV